jgi:molecular chaperone GrpE
MEKKESKKTKKHELDEMRMMLQRAQADFLNYKRRNEEDRANFIKQAHAEVIEQILPVLDNFKRAAEHVPESLKDDGWVTGIKSIEKQLEKILEDNGLEKIETNGQEFDPNIHEAIGQTADPNQKNNTIVSEELAGYFLNGKLLRPAKVIVNQIK